jgi:hypothetical protein
MSFHRLFLAAAVAAFFSMVGLYTIAFDYQFGAPIESGYDLFNWKLFKGHLAQQTAGKRVLIVGDSNALFGIDSAYAEKELGRPVINMALHGGFPLDAILSMALSHARNDDIVVMPLVWNYYKKDYRVPYDWVVNQIIAWNRPYFDGLSLLRKLRYFAAVSPAALYNNITTQSNREAIIKQHPARQLKSPDEAIADYYKLALTRSSFAYSYLNMDLHGNMRFNCGVRVDAKAIPIASIVNKHSLTLLLDTIRELNARGVQVFVTAPVYVDDDISRAPECQASVKKLWDTLRREGVPLLGGPTDYFFPPMAFFDTPYHLNCNYSSTRTEILVRALKAATPMNETGRQVINQMPILSPETKVR